VVYDASHSRRHPAEPRRGPVPRLARIGAATIAFGLVLDVTEHSFATGSGVGSIGFSLGEHAAHLVVLIGMVLVLAGVIAVGFASADRQGRQKGSSRDAIR
jgi:hypothetical protein